MVRTLVTACGDKEERCEQVLHHADSTRLAESSRTRSDLNPLRSIRDRTTHEPRVRALGGGAGARRGSSGALAVLGDYSIEHVDEVIAQRLVELGVPT